MFWDSKAFLFSEHVLLERKALLSSFGARFQAPVIDCLFFFFFFFVVVVLTNHRLERSLYVTLKDNVKQRRS